jgi:hypothetical protein
MKKINKNLKTFLVSKGFILPTTTTRPFKKLQLNEEYLELFYPKDWSPHRIIDTITGYFVQQGLKAEFENSCIRVFQKNILIHKLEITTKSIDVVCIVIRSPIDLFDFVATQMLSLVQRK